MEQLSLDQQNFPGPLTAGVGRSGSGSHRAARGNVTEIIMPPSQRESFQLLLPMLTQLNREERWLAWIDPPAELVQKWQQHHGIVPGQLLVLHSSEQHSALDMAEKALAAGTCHAVVLWTERLGKCALQRLEQASEGGCSHGVVLRERP